MNDKTGKTRTFRECEKCGEPVGKHVFRCDEHYKCDECGTSEGLCFRGPDGLHCDKCWAVVSARLVEQFAASKESTNCTDDMTCPFCGYVQRDSWEISGDDGTHECGRCERTFEYERHVSVSYSTTKPRGA